MTTTNHYDVIVVGARFVSGSKRPTNGQRTVVIGLVVNKGSIPSAPSSRDRVTAWLREEAPSFRRWTWPGT